MGSEMCIRDRITGASGLLGNNLARYFRDRFEVLGLYRAHPVAMDGVRMAAVDLDDRPALAAILREFRPDVVVHCVALVNLDGCEDDPAAADRVNVGGTRAVVEALPAGARLVHISTDAVYDGVRGRFRETDPVAPLNVYGQTKLRAEAEAACAPGALVLRTNIFGWNVQDKQSLGEWVLAQLRGGRRFGGFTDAIFSTIYTMALGAVIEEAVAKGLAGVYNAGAHDALSKYEFAVGIARGLGLDEGLVEPKSVDAFGFRARRGKDLSMDSGKLERDLGRRLPTVAESIAAFLADERAGVPQAIRAGRLGRADAAGTVPGANR